MRQFRKFRGGGSAEWRMCPKGRGTTTNFKECPKIDKNWPNFLRKKINLILGWLPFTSQDLFGWALLKLFQFSCISDLRNSSSTSTDSELKALYKCVLNSDENTCQILLELSTKSSLSDIQISYEATPPICFHAPVQKLPILCKW